MLGLHVMAMLFKNCHFVNLAFLGIHMLLVRKQNLFVLFICNSRKRNSHLLKKT